MNCKIILLTCLLSFKDKTIIKNINPNGLVIKNDLTFDELLFAFDKVIKNETYYSQSVIKMLESQDKGIEIDLFDKQIYFIYQKELRARPNTIYSHIYKCNRSSKVKS
jgi:hypothetical protein